MSLIAGRHGLVLGGTVVGRVGGAAFPADAVAAYKFSSGALTVDATGRGNTLTNTNSVTAVAGKIGDAAQFVAASMQSLSVNYSGATGYGDLETRAVVAGDGGFDFEMVGAVQMKSLIDNAQITPIWGMSRAAGVGTNPRGQFVLNNATNRFEFRAYSNLSGLAIAISPVVPAIDQWYWIDCYHDSVNDLLGISVDGAAFATGAFAGGPNPGLTNTTLFAWGSGYKDGVGYYASCLVDCWAKWGKLGAGQLLTTQQRADLYNGGAGMEWSA